MGQVFVPYCVSTFQHTEPQPQAGGCCLLTYCCQRINGHRLLGLMNSNHDLLTWLFWFSNTEINVSLSLKSILLMPFLVFFCLSTLPSFPFFLPVLPSLAGCYSFLYLLFWYRINTSQLQGRTIQSRFQFPIPCKGPACIHAHYGSSSGLIHGLSSFSAVFSLAQHIRREGIFTWKSLQPCETFPHAHVLARDLLHP